MDSMQESRMTVVTTISVITVTQQLAIPSSRYTCIYLPSLLPEPLCSPNKQFLWNSKLHLRLAHASDTNCKGCSNTTGNSSNFILWFPPACDAKWMKPAVRYAHIYYRIHSQTLWLIVSQIKSQSSQHLGVLNCEQATRILHEVM